MEPTLDSPFLHEIVSQREQRLRREADRYALAHAAPTSSRSRTTRARPARARHRLAAALHHLAERIEPARLDPRSAAR